MRYLGEEEFVRDLGQLEEAMRDWRRYRENISLRELLDNRDIQNMVLYAMLVTIQAAIRTAHHLIIRDYLPKPGSYEETFIILRKNDVLDAVLADALIRLALYRQKLVHSRSQLNLREIYETMTTEWDALELYYAKLKQISRS